MKRCVLVLGVALLLGPDTSRAGVIRVPGDYPSFRQGLAAAGPGDTLLLGPGIYSEPGGPAYIQPGVTVIGAGWDPELVPGGTSLYNIELFFLAGSLPTVVENLRIGNLRVSSDHSLGTVRRCMFGPPDGYWSDGYMAYIAGGLTIEDCFIMVHITQEPHIYFKVHGGNTVIRNNVFALIEAINFMRVQNASPYPLTLLDVRDNTFFASAGFIWSTINGYPPIPGTVRFINNIFQVNEPSGWIIIECINGARATVGYNDFYASTTSIGCTVDSTNLFVDPMLCEPSAYYGVPKDFGLEYGSPCVGAGENGTTIGALEVLCGIPAAVHEGAVPSWGPLLLDVAPNPLVAAGGLVTLGLEAAVPATLRLYSASGRLELAHKLDATGGVMRLTLREALGARAARGTHFLELSQGRHRAVRKLVVLE